MGDIIAQWPGSYQSPTISTINYQHLSLSGTNPGHTSQGSHFLQLSVSFLLGVLPLGDYSIYNYEKARNKVFIMQTYKKRVQ